MSNGMVTVIGIVVAIVGLIILLAAKKATGKRGGAYKLGAALMVVGLLAVGIVNLANGA